MQYILIVFGVIIIVPFAYCDYLNVRYCMVGVIVFSSLTYALYRDKEDLYYAGCINSKK